MFCGFAIRSREIVICYGLGGLQIPWFDRSNLFLRRISNPSGRLAGYGTPSGGVGRLAGGGIFRAQKSRGILEGESPRQLKFQRPV